MIEITKSSILTAINQYDWQLSCACNTLAATTLIPLILSGLICRERKEWAYSEATNVLWHQGTIYEATGHTIPFLTQMLLLPINDEDELCDISNLIAIFTLSGRCAAEGNQSCGLQVYGEQVINFLKIVSGICISFLHYQNNLLTRQNILVALMQIPKFEENALEIAYESRELKQLAKKLCNSTYKEAWDIFESL